MGAENINQPSNNLENRERPLAGKVALITGAERNIGEAIAKTLARERICGIIGTYVDPKKKNLAKNVNEELLSQGVKSEILQLDITNEDHREKLKQATEVLFGGKLDFLILNASGPGRDVNVIAANGLVDKFLPIMPSGSKIVLLQSVPGHFCPQLKDLNIMPEDYVYRPVAEAKYAGEQSLGNRIKEFEEKGVLFIVICPPEVSDTGNVRAYKRIDPLLSAKNAAMSELFDLPTTTTKRAVGEKVAELLKRNDLPMGYIEFFKTT